MSVSIGTIIAVCSLIVAFLGYQLSTKRETKSDTQDNAELKAGLEYIRQGVDNIRIDIRANEKQMAHLGERVTRVEESAKQAHKRIDHMEGDE